ncbi:MAG: 4-alpha-glucanotransferase [Rhodopseudomonas palustris]|nr:4-alpha-glucanotransferase [Rhodopseudomonas palustris]
MQRLARELGMPIGLYGDYAVGVNPSGSETWSDQRVYRMGAGVGAPPDRAGAQGPGLGHPAAGSARAGRRALPAVPRPHRREHAPLRRAAPRPRDGAVPPVVGAGGPRRHRRRLRALPARRPDGGAGARERAAPLPRRRRGPRHRAATRCAHAMAEFAVYSYKVLLFEKHADGRFRRPEEYVRRAIATVTTHDLPTLRGYWSGKRPRAARSTAAVPGRGDPPLRLRRARARPRRSCARRSTRLACGRNSARESESGYSEALAHDGAALPRAQRRRAGGAADRGPDRHDRPGQRAGHQRRARQLAAQGDHEHRRRARQRVGADGCSRTCGARGLRSLRPGEARPCDSGWRTRRTIPPASSCPGPPRSNSGPTRRCTDVERGLHRNPVRFVTSRGRDLRDQGTARARRRARVLAAALAARS